MCDNLMTKSEIANYLQQHVALLQQKKPPTPSLSKRFL